LSIVKPTLDLVLGDYGIESVKFLGKQTKEQLAQLRAKITAIICGSRFESFSMVAGEAFLSGCPLILSDRSGLRALVERYNAARLVNPYDAADFASALNEMESEEFRNIYLKGGDGLADYLTSPELAEKTAGFYQQVAAR
jgi:glycosyltransferase involved in cell wall biosynthesis